MKVYLVISWEEEGFTSFEHIEAIHATKEAAERKLKLLEHHRPTTDDSGYVIREGWVLD